MKRTIQLEVSLSGIAVDRNPKFCQGDMNTHYMQISFLEDIVLDGYTLQVYYLPPYPSITPYVDLFYNLKQVTEVPIPNRLLSRNGKVKVEFALSKGEELITVNKTFEFDVLRTINGCSLTAYPDGELNETIAQQIKKIKVLLAQTDEKIAEYNSNAKQKTNSFNSNSVEKTEQFDAHVLEKINEFNTNSDNKVFGFNNNASAKTREFDAHVSTTVNEAYTNLDRKAEESANTASAKANELVVVQQRKSIQAVTEEGNKQKAIVVKAGADSLESINLKTSEIIAEGDKQVKAVQTQGNTSKALVEQTGTAEVGKVNTASQQATISISTAQLTAVNAVKAEGTTQSDNVKRVSIKETDKAKQLINTAKNNAILEVGRKADEYVKTASKSQIDEYVSQKELEIKGATYTPEVSTNGDISWTNDRGLPNPETQNIKGVKGDPGNFIFKVEDGNLILYTVENEQRPVFTIDRNGNLIMEIA